MSVLDITIDPRPTLPDHHMWDKLLKLAPQHGGEILNRALYMIRAAGAKLEDQQGRMKIIPMYEPEGSWHNEAEWKEWARPTLLRFAAEIVKCLELVRE